MLELVKENVGLSDDTIKECQIGYDKEKQRFLIANDCSRWKYYRV